MNYYELLDIPRKASREEIRAAYLRLAREVHPDRHVGTAEESERKKFKQIQQAYEVLYDRKMREAYDLQHGAIPQPRARATPQTQTAYQGPVRSTAGVRRDVPNGWGRRSAQPARVFTLFRLIGTAMTLALVVSAIPHCGRYLQGQYGESFATGNDYGDKIANTRRWASDVKEKKKGDMLNSQDVSRILNPKTVSPLPVEKATPPPIPVAEKTPKQSIGSMAEWVLQNQDDATVPQDQITKYSLPVVASEGSHSVVVDDWKEDLSRPMSTTERWSQHSKHAERRLGGPLNRYAGPARDGLGTGWSLAPTIPAPTIPPPPSFGPSTTIPPLPHAPPINTGTSRYDSMLPSNDLPLTGGRPESYSGSATTYGQPPSTYGQPMGRSDFGYGGLNTGGYAPPAIPQSNYGGSGGLQQYEIPRDGGAGRSRTSSLLRN